MSKELKERVEELEAKMRAAQDKAVSLHEDKDRRLDALEKRVDALEEGDEEEEDEDETEESDDEPAPPANDD